jgi:hypothetical protein
VLALLSLPGQQLQDGEPLAWGGFTTEFLLLNGTPRTQVTRQEFATCPKGCNQSASCHHGAMLLPCCDVLCS